MLLEQSGNMQVAAFLSDLKSLSVCSHEAALNLVCVYKTADIQVHRETVSTRDEQKSTSNEDDDRKRADELALLHRDVKLKHARAPDTGLAEARAGIRRIIQDLDRD